jgi:predicted lipid carrier protein YhbT
MLVELTHETGTRRWLVTIDRGNVTVVEDPGAATSTCTLRTSAATFELIACGQGNAMAAALRGDLLIEGDVQLLLLFQRLFPGPPGARHPREFVQAGRSE